MKYLNQKCSHCEKLFTKDDDVVVCPICGTPQHRECYEENNKCINHDKHKEGYVWSAEATGFAGDSEATPTPEFIICNNCGTKNSGDSFFCKHCSAPLGSQNNAFGGFNGYQNQSNQENPDFQGMPFVTTTFKINENDEIAPDVKLVEAQKYVKNNSLLYSLIFKRIHDHDKSRFNFAAFLFSGGWFLYRKQYLIGTILTVLFAIFSIIYNVLYTPVYDMLENYNIIIDNAISYEQLYVLSNEQLGMISLMGFSYFFRFILMIISGLIANRCYYKHVVNKVRLAKKKFTSDTEVREHLSKAGGVNVVLGYILFIAYALVSSIPFFM